MTLVHPYLWAIALLLEGALHDSVDVLRWSYELHAIVRILPQACRQDKPVSMDHQGYISVDKCLVNRPRDMSYAHTDETGGSCPQITHKFDFSPFQYTARAVPATSPSSYPQFESKHRPNLC